MNLDVKSAEHVLRAADEAMAIRDYRRAAMLLQDLPSHLPHSVDILLRLAVARRASGDVPGALDPANAAVVLEPTSLSALLLTASLLDALGRRDEAVVTYQKALFCAPDRRYLPPPFLAELDKARAFIDRHRSWRTAVSTVRFEQCAAGDDTAKLERFRQNILAGPSPDGLPGQFVYPGLTSAEFYDPRTFAGVAALEQSTQTISDEFAAIASARAPELVDAIAHGVGNRSASFDRNQATRRWTAIRLIDDGRDVTENTRYCPQTVALYRALIPPEIAGRSPNLMFSILDPATKIPSHHGVTNTRLVLHIPLLIPPHCALRVGNSVRHWERGKALIFDDTINHEAWNDSGHVRVILLGDIWHPGLSPYERNGVVKLMSQPDR